MNPSDFGPHAAGSCAKTLRGYYAFTPHPLPPEVIADWRLASLLSEADRAIAELSGIARYLPNPHILMSPYMRKEAVLSSKIENTQAGLEDLFAFEADATDQRTADVQEVANYVRALEEGLSALKTLPICSRLICRIHEVLLKGVRGSGVRPGEYRTTQNWIGRPGCTLSEATFVPVPAEDLFGNISQFESYINAENIEEPPLVQCAYLHYQFEALHPFADGNGRVGRLLIPLFLCARGHLSQPLLYLSEFFEEHREEYYRLLLAVSQNGRWRDWLEFFLTGVSLQAKDAFERSKTLIDLNHMYRAQLGVKRIPEAALRLVDQIFVNPIVTPAKLSKEWSMSFPTLMKGIEKLVEIGALSEVTGRMRNRVYKAEEIYRILDKKVGVSR